jgi:hypothetical protein
MDKGVDTKEPGGEGKLQAAVCAAAPLLFPFFRFFSL